MTVPHSSNSDKNTLHPSFSIYKIENRPRSPDFPLNSCLKNFPSRSQSFKFPKHKPIYKLYWLL